MSKIKSAMKDAKQVFKKGNILLLAIGLLIGTVFGALVKSLADDIIMAPISKLLGFDELKNMVYGGVRVGNFLAALLTFIIVSLMLFVLLVGYFVVANHVKAKKEAKNPTPAPAAPAPTTEELILAELQKLNENIKK
ncbi:MscL family protein [Mycoplasmopsis glycophila]|uniref:Large conductance mechanosensitive channel protein n=1 Tax=Mycoplasmopsis glycophila TaxID=171285 RepID=A0A449AW62_9BACT|nr:MscL family protein [Mycoplasmopsis glycophila]VEU70867.1 large conductance mechanosensitive channel protein [Mycoplasmopsis glycophila]